MTQCIYQIQVGVAINEAGEDDAAGAVDGLIVVRNGQICTNGSDLVVFHGQVCLEHALRSNQGAVFQNRHINSPFSEKPARRISSMGGFQLS